MGLPLRILYGFDDIPKQDFVESVVFPIPLVAAKSSTNPNSYTEERWRRLLWCRDCPGLPLNTPVGVSRLLGGFWGPPNQSANLDIHVRIDYGFQSFSSMGALPSAQG